MTLEKGLLFFTLYKKYLYITERILNKSKVNKNKGKAFQLMLKVTNTYYVAVISSKNNVFYGIIGLTSGTREPRGPKLHQ